MQSGIREKLNAFIKMHYRQRLIRGGMAVGAMGLMVFGTAFLTEHFLWLDSEKRAWLFWSIWLLFLPMLTLGVIVPFLHWRGVGVSTI